MSLACEVSFIPLPHGMRCEAICCWLNTPLLQLTVFNNKIGVLVRLEGMGGGHIPRDQL